MGSIFLIIVRFLFSIHPRASFANDLDDLLAATKTHSPMPVANGEKLKGLVLGWNAAQAWHALMQLPPM
jgi:hypothetical protein